MKFDRLFITALVLAILTLTGCTAIKVEKLDQSNPAGLPFYMDKPMVKVTTIEYSFYNLTDKTLINKVQTIEKEIVSVPDTNAAYTLNQQRAFAGENKFKLERTNGYNISKIETENKEGLTEFLKGLVEGAKTITELAKEAAKDLVKPAGALTDAEATYFANLATNQILAIKTVLNISYEELNK